MNWEIFSPIGYASVVLLGCVVLLWLAHWLIRPRKWLAHLAVVVALLAMIFAKVNSQSHVNRLAVDQTEVVQKEMAARELARQQAEAERAEDTADIAFAEDAAGDRLDKAGLDDTDLAYFESFDEEAPAWKQQKQTRDQDTGGDDDLEAMIGGTTEREGVNVEGMQAMDKREPIFLSEADLLTANRLDKVNLSATRWVLVLAILLVVVDYVRRLNVDREAYFPLPVPSSWVDSLSERPVVVTQADKPRRTLEEDLKFLTRRGEAFLLLTMDGSLAANVVGKLPRLPGGLWPMTVLSLEEHAELDDRFIFETLWFSRNSFVLENEARSLELLERFVYWLGLRRDVKAKTRRSAHLVWDLDAEVPAALIHRIEILGKKTGFRLLICRAPKLREAAA